MRAARGVELSAEASGEVIAITVRSGDTVDAGQPLLTLNDSVELASRKRQEAMTPAKIAAPVAYLLSDAASDVSGGCGRVTRRPWRARSRASAMTFSWSPTRWGSGGFTPGGTASAA